MQQPTSAVQLQLHVKKKKKKWEKEKKEEKNTSATKGKLNGGISNSALLELGRCSQGGLLNNNEHVKGSSMSYSRHVYYFLFF